MCIHICVEVVLINILASHLAPQTKIPGSAPTLIHAYQFSYGKLHEYFPHYVAKIDSSLMPFNISDEMFKLYIK